MSGPAGGPHGDGANAAPGATGAVAGRADAPASDFPFAAHPPRGLERPDDRRRLAELLATTSGAVVPIDGARERTLSAPLDADAWLAIDVRGLDRLVDWQPDDLTVTVESGMPLADLARRLAERSQWLPLDAPDVPGATVGHVVADALVGPRGTRFGGPRRHLIGLTTVDGRGTPARAGGRLVKNVAGYDLMKLHAGARETLGLLVELTFRLQPLPETLLRLEGRVPDVAAAADLARAVTLGGFEPDLFQVTAPPGGPGFEVRLEFSGFAEDVRDEAAAVRALAPALDWRTTEEPGAAVLGRPAADAVGVDSGGTTAPTPGEPRAAAPPDRIDLETFVPAAQAPAVLEQMSAWAAADPTRGTRLEWDPFLARVRLVGTPRPTGDGRGDLARPRAADVGADLARPRAADVPGEVAAPRAADIESLRAGLAANGLRLRLRGWGPGPGGAATPATPHELLDGAPPATLDLLRGLKRAFDPDRRLQPGRFFWGL